jgi:hypothetical protein
MDTEPLSKFLYRRRCLSEARWRRERRTTGWFLGVGDIEHDVGGVGIAAVVVDQMDA